jgi:ATP-dependent Clp protease ATP-binding subunit ClpA
LFNRLQSSGTATQKRHQNACITRHHNRIASKDIALLTEKVTNQQFGGRPVKRVIQRDVLYQLSTAILSGTTTTDSIVLIDAFDGKLVFRNQSELVH